MAAPTFPHFSSTSFSLFIFVFLLLLLPDLHHCEDRFTDCTSSRRSLLVSARRSRAGNQIQSCEELVDPSNCNRNPNCRWCRSETIDDMCFHKSESWRLPSEVFICDQRLPSSRSMN